MVRFAGRTTRRARRLLKMLGMLVRQLFVQRAAEHPAGLMTEPFDLGERRVDWRSVGAKPFLREQGHQFIELLPCFRRQH